MKWQYFPSVGIKAPLHQWDMSHYGLLLDLAKMYDGRSRAATTRTTTILTKTITMTTALPLLLLLLAVVANQSAAMSLDRLALERNELSAPAESQPSQPASTVVVDDMKMAALPAHGATDMYMLVPESVASQLEDTEHVHRNTIEETAAEAAAEAENAAVGESTDMLMLESDDTPAMQLVEMPSDITVSELKPEIEAEPHNELEPVAAEIAEPELIEEHVVEQPAQQSVEQMPAQPVSQEAQLENADALPEATTEAAPAIEEIQADDETVPVVADMENSTQAAMEEEIKSEVEPEQTQEADSEMADSQPDTVEQEITPEQPKIEAAETAENEVDTTESSSMLESMAEGIEQALSAAMMPAEINVAEPESDSEPEAAAEVELQLQADEHAQETASPAEETPAEQPIELETQTEVAELVMESATEQIVEEAQPVVANDAEEEVNAEQPEENQINAENPAETPVENLVETPEETPAEAPEETPVETADETPVEIPAEVPAKTPEEVPAETPEETPIEIHEEIPAEIPAETPAETPLETLTETPAEVDTPAETPVEIQSEPVVEAEKETISAVEAEPSDEAAVEPAAFIEPEMQKEPEQAQEAMIQETDKQSEVLADEVPEVVEAQPEPQAEIHEETKVEPEAEQESLPQADPELTEPQAVTESVVQAMPEQEVQVMPEPEPQAVPEPEPEPQAAPQAEPQAEIPVAVQPQPDQSILTTIIPAVPQMPAVPAQQAPVQVMDSVLNYVNASFMQAQQDQLQPEPELVTETPFNAQLRRYDGAQVWRIVVQTDKDKKLADELQSKYDGQLWKEVKQEVDYLLKPQVLAAAERHIRAANLSRIVLIDNLQQVIEVENPPAEKIAELQNRKGHRLTWQAYHRLEDIHGFIDYMAKTYPDICSTETIGYSVEKRPLKILKISNGNARNPGVWIDGGMHAREWISPATVTYIANQLVEGWEDLPEHMRNINWYIHPVANPDGYEYSHTTDRLWRKNMRAHGRQCPGVDLNRNFGYKWGGKGTSASPCSQTYRGSKAFSEPETFYISKFISGFPRDTFQAYLSFHSYGQYILYPWGYDYTLTKDRSDLDRVARQAGSIITKSSGVKYTVGSSATTLYPAAGGSDDWAKGIAGIKYAYTIEMGDTGRYGFVLPAQFIQYNGKDGYTFADTVARAVIQGRSKQSRSSSNSSRRRIR